MIRLDSSSAPWKEGNGYRKQLLLSEDSLQCKGALVQIVEIPVGSSVPMHFHKTSIEVFHVLEGEGQMTIAGNLLTLGQGDMATTEPGDPHDARNTSDCPWRFLVFKTNAQPEDIFWVQ